MEFRCYQQVIRLIVTEMLVRVILPVALRTWTRTKSYWILANIFYILPDWFCLFHIFFCFTPDLRLWFLFMLFFNWGSRINKQTKHKTRRQKTTMLCKSLWYSLDPKFLSGCLLFAFFLHNTTYWRIVYISYHHIFTFYSFFNLFQLSFIHFIPPYLLLPNSMVTFLFSSYSTSQQQFNMVNHFLKILAIFWGNSLSSFSYYLIEHLKPI